MAARAMPVLPDDGSSSVWPGFREPSFSASSIMQRAMRSLTEPKGFWPSSFTSRRASGLGDSELTSTSGVLPISPRTLVKAAIRGRPSGAGRLVGCASRHGREDGDQVAVLDLGVELVEVADVVVVLVHVDELVQRPVLGHDVAGHRRELADPVLEHLADGRAVGVDRRSTPGVLPEN